MTIELQYEERLNRWEIDILNDFDDDNTIMELMEFVPDDFRLTFLIRLADDLKVFKDKHCNHK